MFQLIQLVGRVGPEDKKKVIWSHMYQFHGLSWIFSGSCVLNSLHNSTCSVSSLVHRDINFQRFLDTMQRDGDVELVGD